MLYASEKTYSKFYDSGVNSGPCCSVGFHFRPTKTCTLCRRKETSALMPKN